VITLFEEYRYINFGANDEKDPNEPFFMKPKQRYLEEKLRRKREEAARIREEERQNQIRINTERAKAQIPLIEKYLDIVKNHPEEILKSKYEYDREDDYATYGILLRDKSQLIANTYNRKLSKLRINGQYMSSYIEPKLNLDEDPFGEENWDSSKSKFEILGELIIDYVKENEIIF